MKKKLVLLCITGCVFVALLSAQHVYYVAPTGGDDSNAGTDIDFPWATWQKAFDTAVAGDTIYFRGGVYYSSGTSTQPTITPYAYEPHGHSGASGNPICFFAYPGETPILDCSDQYSISSIVSGISLVSCQYIHFKGLTIRNIYQRVQGKLAQAISMGYTANLTFENMTIYNISGRGAGGEVLVGYYDASVTPVTILLIINDFHPPLFFRINIIRNNLWT